MFVFAFERLDTWKLSIELTTSLYQLTRKFPSHERYGLGQQIQRAAVSISSNIAEGSGRLSKKDQAHFFNIAFSSLLEVLNQIILANRIGYIEQAELDNLRNCIERLSRKIAALRKATLAPNLKP
jgi:four helix bundle protein